jgi:hypothetical protein
MKMSKAGFAKRWGVPKSTAWTWLKKVQAEGIIDSKPNGKRNEHVVRGCVDGNGSGADLT